jgi:hypothetical protein
LREREVEMARKTGKRGSAIILLAVVVVLAAGSPAILVKAFGPAGSSLPTVDASWAE